MNKKLRKYIAELDYIDKALIFFMRKKWRTICYFFCKRYWSYFDYRNTKSLTNNKK